MAHLNGEVKTPIHLVLETPLVVLAFFGDKIAILTMKMIFYKLLAIAAGIQLLKSNLCPNFGKSNAGFSENVKKDNSQNWLKSRDCEFLKNRNSKVRN